jgi:hypothetical protein
MENKTEARRLAARYERLRKKLVKTGPVRAGTLYGRIDDRDDPRWPGTRKKYGPYYQWTFKREGKTVSANLSGSQAPLWRRAIAEHRKLETILAEMRDISRKLLEATTQGPQRREHNKRTRASARQTL